MARMSRDLRAVGNFAFFGATCFLISAMIYIDGYAIQYTFQSQAPGGMEGYLNLSTSNLQARWEGRRQSQAAFLLAELFGAVAWFTLMGPIGALCDLLGGESRSGTSNDRAQAHAQHARLTQCGGNRGRILHHEPREHAGGVEAKAEECHERASNGEAAESLGD